MAIQFKMIVYSKSIPRLINYFNQKKIINELDIFNAIDSVSNYEIYKNFALSNNLIKPKLIEFIENTYVNNKPLYGILGCYLSHIFILNDFINNPNYNWLLVLEDDIQINYVNINILVQEAESINSNFIQLYTHPRFISDQLKEPLLTPHLRKMAKQWGTQSYLINKKAVEFILKLIPSSDAIDIIFNENINNLNSTCFLNNNFINIGSYDCKLQNDELGSIIMNNP